MTANPLLKLKSSIRTHCLAPTAVSKPCLTNDCYPPVADIAGLAHDRPGILMSIARADVRAVVSRAEDKKPFEQS